MSFVKATLRDSERKIFINMSHVTHMVVDTVFEGAFTIVCFENGDHVYVTESPEELICEAEVIDA